MALGFVEGFAVVFEVGLGCPWVRGLGLIRGGETQWQVDKKGVRNLGGSKKDPFGVEA